MTVMQRALDLLKELLPMPRFHADDLPVSPPAEVLAEVDAAWERARELFESGMDLHFEVDALVGRVSAELRTAGGEVAERYSAREALAFACGDPVLRTARFDSALVA
jgi:hypothetical protein